MYIYQELTARETAGKPVQVGLIGAGKFGSMFYRMGLERQD
jgi:predicted homoserine dehydrogenase-like protein